MYELQTYVAVIVNEDCDQFDIALAGISRDSNVRSGQRLSTIIPMDRITIYEVDLMPDEALVLKLGCPGELIYTATCEVRDNLMAELQEQEWLNDPSK